MLMRLKPALIIKTLNNNDLNVSKTATDLGIHRSTVWRWKKRASTPLGYKTYIRERNLYRKSTRPHNIRTVLTTRQIVDIIELRKSKNLTAIKIKHLLSLDVGVNTIHRVLKRNGLTNKYGNHIRPRFQKTNHMYLKNTKTVGYLQMDVKYVTPELSGLPWTCYEYAIIDIFSRYKDAVILNHLNQDNAISALLTLVPRLPFKPVFIQTDNGLEFQSRFVKHAKALGLRYHYIHKSSPNENAVIERSFRTDEEEFYFYQMKTPIDYDDLRDQYTQYLYWYNNERPHLGINLKTPAEVVANVVGD